LSNGQARHWSETVKFETVDLQDQIIRPEFKLTRKGPAFARLDDDHMARLRRNVTLYDPAYCEQVIEHMGAGYSLSAYAGWLGVAPQTLRNWGREFPAFALACEKGRSARLQYWERLGLRVAETGGVGSQATMIIFGLKNMGMGEWKEKQEVEHSGSISLAALVESSLKNVTPRQAVEIEGELAPMQIEHSHSSG
jgi:transposase